MNLSVIIANYNNGNYIRDCLDSILNQTYKDIDIIVADDCSTDNSQEIVKEYEKKYPGVIKCIFSPINKGVARTRHEAILQARGEYITTLDSDDYFFDFRKLEKEMELIRSYKKENSKDIFSFSNIVLVREDRSFITKRSDFEPIKEGYIFDDIISRSCMIPRDFIMKKSYYFRLGGYDFSFPIYEDWDLKIRLAQKCEFCYTGLDGTAYRIHGKGLSSIPIQENIEWMKKVFQKNLSLANPECISDIKKIFYQFVEKIELQRG